MNKKNLFQYFFTFLILIITINSQAQLKGPYLQDWVMGFIPACYKNQRASAINSLMSDERLGKFCTCSAFKTGLNPILSNDLIDKVNLKQAKIPSEIHNGVLSYCTDNFANYNSAMHIGNRKSPAEFFFDDGQKHRFIAVQKTRQDLNRNQIDLISIPVGETFADIFLSEGKSILSLTTNEGYSAKSDFPAVISDYGKVIGADFGFSISDGIVSFDIEKSTMLVQRLIGNNYELTHYVLSKKLICDTLATQITNRNAQMVGGLLKEALIFALRSYAGASYSAGTISGLNSSGNPYRANVTIYNNSWMGEHYSKGLDELFNGVADVSSVAKQKEKIGCPN
jgi:hypothetical protein